MKGTTNHWRFQRRQHRGYLAVLCFSQPLGKASAAHSLVTPSRCAWSINEFSNGAMKRSKPGTMA
jgi:hypothetical protein